MKKFKEIFLYACGMIFLMNSQWHDMIIRKEYGKIRGCNV